MVLVTGARFQGKLEFALGLAGVDGSQVAEGSVCSLDDLREKVVINHFELAVKRMSEEEISVTEQVASLCYYNPYAIVIVNEIAYGTEDEQELLWREKAGKAARLLAEQAEEVYHLVCGIPVKLKGE